MQRKNDNLGEGSAGHVMENVREELQMFSQGKHENFFSNICMLVVQMRRKTTSSCKKTKLELVSGSYRKIDFWFDTGKNFQDNKDIKNMGYGGAGPVAQVVGAPCS